jgi:DNA anti-recombination protein RmuC
MKNSYMTTVAAAVLAASLAGAPAIAADGQSETAEQIARTYDDVSDYTVEQKDKAVSWLAERVEALDAQMDEFDRSLADAGDSMAAKWAEVKDDLAEKREAAADQLAEMKQATAEAWDDARDSAVENMQKLEDSFEAAKREYSR